MKRFRNLFLLVLITAFAAACSKDDPKDVRDDYMGTYSGTNIGTSTSATGFVQNFNVATTAIVTKNAADNTKITFSFASTGTKYDATVSGNNFVIQNQTATFVSTTGGTGTYTISGSGNRNGNTITYNYVIGISGGIQKGTATLNK